MYRNKVVDIIESDTFFKSIQNLNNPPSFYRNSLSQQLQRIPSSRICVHNSSPTSWDILKKSTHVLITNEQT